MEKLTDKSPTDIVLVDSPKPPGNQTPQHSKNRRRVRIPRNDARAKNCQTLKADAPHRVFFFAHDAGIANPALSATAGCRKKSEPFDARFQAATRKRADDANFQRPDILLAPLLASFTDADTRCGK